MSSSRHSRAMVRRGRPRGPGIIMPTSDGVAATPPVDLPEKFTTEIETPDGKIVEITIQATDLEKMEELGRGAYGVVDKWKHKETEVIMAVKRIHVTINDEEQKRMLIELQTSMQSGRCPYMVRCYGAMFREGDVWICMEVMDTSLDRFYKMCVDQDRPIPETLLSKVAHSAILGLQYMKDQLSLMHRDVKPSNILLSRKGQIKICDFGISGHLTNSIAKTVNAGCKPYMAPERIDGEHKTSYDIRSDVWSLGISMIEVATGTHPYAKWRTPFEQLKQVVNEPPPQLPKNGKVEFSDEFCDFICQCLKKNSEERPRYDNLLLHPWVKKAEEVSDESVGQFITEVIDACDSQKAETTRLLGSTPD